MPKGTKRSKRLRSKRQNTGTTPHKVDLQSLFSATEEYQIAGDDAIESFFDGPAKSISPTTLEESDPAPPLAWAIGGLPNKSKNGPGDLFRGPAIRVSLEDGQSGDEGSRPTKMTHGIIVSLFSIPGSAAVASHNRRLVQKHCADLSDDAKKMLVIAITIASLTDRGERTIDVSHPEYESFCEADLPGLDIDNHKLLLDQPATRLKFVLESLNDEKLLQDAMRLMSHIAALGFARVHALGALANAEKRGANVISAGKDTLTSRDASGSGGQLLDGFVDRVGASVGLSTSSATARQTVYKIVKFFNRVALGYDVYSLVIDEIASTSTGGGLSFIVPRFYSKKRSEAWFSPAPDLSDIPRFNNGPAGSRSLNRGFESAIRLVKVGAPFGVQGLFTELHLFGNSVSGILPYRMLLHPAVISHLSKAIAGVNDSMALATVKIARQSAKKLNLASALLQESVDGVKITAPADIKAAREHPHLAAQVKAFGAALNNSVTDEALLRRILGVIGVGASALSKESTDFEIKEAYDKLENVLKPTENDIDDEIRLSLEKHNKSVQRASMIVTEQMGMKGGLAILNATQAAAEDGEANKRLRVLADKHKHQTMKDIGDILGVKQKFKKSKRKVKGPVARDVQARKKRKIQPEAATSESEQEGRQEEKKDGDSTQSEDGENRMRAWSASRTMKLRKKHDLKAGITGDMKEVKRRSKRTREPAKPSFEPGSADKEEEPEPDQEPKQEPLGFSEGPNFKKFSENTPGWQEAGFRTFSALGRMVQSGTSDGTYTSRTKSAKAYLNLDEEDQKVVKENKGLFDKFAKAVYEDASM